MFILITSFSFSQTVFKEVSQKSNKAKFDFVKFDFTVPFIINEDRGQKNNLYPNMEKNNFFIPDGLGAKIGYGFHYKKLFSITANTGLDIIFSEKLVASPLFAQVCWMPKFNNDYYLSVQVGYGKSFALGRGSLSGDYKKLSIGVDNQETQFFIEIATHGFAIKTNNSSITTLSLGISVNPF